MARHVIPMAILWAVVIGRLSMLRRPRGPRVLWAALAFLAAAETLQLKAVYQWVNDIARSPVAGPTLKLALAVGAAAGVRTLIATLTGQPTRAARRDSILAAAVVAVFTIPLIISPPTRLSPAVLASTEYYDTTWRSWVHWLPFLAYLSWALGGGVVLCWRYGRQAPPGPLRTGLTLIGSGCALGFGYVALKLAILAAWHTDVSTAPHWMDIGDGSIGTLVLGVCIITIAVGCAWEAIAARREQARNAVWAARSLRHLRPLWNALTDLYPNIALTKAADDSTGRLRYRLLRRVVEIRDGILALQDRTDPAVIAAVQDRIRAAGHTGTQADAMVVATIILWAQHSPTVSDSTGAELPAGDSTDLESEVPCLTLASKALNSTLARQTAGELATIQAPPPTASTGSWPSTTSAGNTSPA